VPGRRFSSADKWKSRHEKRANSKRVFAAMRETGFDQGGAEWAAVSVKPVTTRVLK